MEMTTLDELERLLKAGTPKPWERALNVVIAGSERVAFVWRDEDGQYSAANAALIVAAINALPELLDRVEALEGALKQIAEPQPTFAGPRCCGDTFTDACELFGDIARAALKEQAP